jgi:hypothetical protein
VDTETLERARERIDRARNGRFEAARFEAALERSRRQVEELSRVAADIEAALPDRIGDAVQEGLRREVTPVGRNLAEIRGLLNQALRRLERLEQELLAERTSRLDDLTLLVDLVSSGWRGVDDRLRRIEESGSRGDVVQLRSGPAQSAVPTAV